MKYGDKKWSRELLAELVDWLQEAYPAEGCGLIVEDDDGNWRFRRSENVIDRYHQLDPKTYPRTSKDFYMIDPREFMRVDESGEKVAVIVHSHPDTGHYFSDADADAALMPRDSHDEALEPLYPGTDYLVVSVCDGTAKGASLYRFAAGEFVEITRWTDGDLQDAVNYTAAQEETVA